MKGTIRVLVVDDHFVVRAGVCNLLSSVADIELVGEAADGWQAVEEAERCAPDVILMDLRLPLLGGVEATRQILAAQPGVGIVILTTTDAEADVLAAVEAGAVGYVSKSSPKEELLEAIRSIARGEAWLPPHLTRRLLNHLKPRQGQEVLTGREQDVLNLLARGWSNREIARELGVTDITVRTHVSHVIGKLGVSNRVEAALHALRAGLVPMETH
ncbi:MAG TPA: response regulator transcription factor [Thermoanaerobaculia bacterium]|nr:response regulator transcription factor [Thermoanaerobaculia bacterium]